MQIERNNRDGRTIQALRPGDFVDVRFNQWPNGSVLGYVVNASSERLWLRAHETTGLIESDLEPCINQDLFIPMSSVLWIRHMTYVPDDCHCKEGLR